MTKINGILLLYHHPFQINASTIMEHVNAFSLYSDFYVLNINTEYKFPPFLKKYEFKVIILHYSLFACPICLDEKFLDYLREASDSYKVAFLQDEYRYWPERSEFLNECCVDCVYTLLEPKFFDATYRKKTNIKNLIHNIPGYVSTEIEQMAHQYYLPDHQRTTDIGYRGRRLPYYLGRGSQEKHLIGVEFKKRAPQYNLTVDIETDEHERIYGADWPRFIANCKAVIGVEAGVSVFDIDDQVRPRYAEIVSGHPDVSFPDISFEEVHDNMLKPYENKIYYRTISPRHFEAASLRVCQILFEGKYSGILEPMKHYIPLKKDFSNFDTVIDLFKDPEVRRDLTENAYNDLIASKKYTYKNLINSFDNNLYQQGIDASKAGIDPKVSMDMLNELNTHIRRDKLRRAALSLWLRVRYGEFPGRNILRPVAKPIFAKLKEQFYRKP